MEKFSHIVSSKMLHFQFHRNVLDREISILLYDQRQQNHPNSAKTRKTIIGRMAQQARMTPLLQDDVEKTNWWSISLH